MNHLRRIVLPVLLATTGCYSTEPISTPRPAPGTRVAISINDAGRAALGGTMGPAIGRVEGSLLTSPDDAYVVSVTGVNYLGGGYQSWKGETVRIDPAMTSGLFERKFSKGRTAVLIAGLAVAGSVLAPGAMRSYFHDDPPPPPGSETSRRPIRILLPLR
jgi:hypothetical protein